MALVGYVTVAEATEYIKSRYVSTDELRRAWEAMDEADQAVYLQKSFDAIELLPFRGRKYDCKQQTAFPRWPEKEVPNAVKFAQIEAAIAATDSTKTEEAVFYAKLGQYGVESYSLGNLSESSSSGSWGQFANTSVLNSTQALKLLQPYMNGGYRIG